MITKTISPIHFEDFSGQDFERLVFAYFLRTHRWKKLEWNGQRGNDGGRDIVGVLEVDGAPDKVVCIFCANWQKPTLAKLKSDFNKSLKGNFIPDKYIAIFGGYISSKYREKANQFFLSKKVSDYEIISGIEFEEMVRLNAESLLKRFFDGEVFPEKSEDFADFLNIMTPSSDKEILAQMAFCFDRPAFTTPFRFESYLPGFRRAIVDTISAINTGICKDRDGNIVRKIFPKSFLKSQKLRQDLSKIVDELVNLRTVFDEAIRTGGIKDYGGKYDETSTVEFRDSKVCQQLDIIRSNILRRMKKIYPEFPYTFM